MMRETIDTTYADLRPSDLVIDRSGQAWPIAEFRPNFTGQQPASPSFWLCDPVTKVKMHHMVKPGGDPVKVSRLPTQADEALKLEAEFPNYEAGKVGDAPPYPEALNIDANYVDMDEAVAAVEEIGGTVEADFPKPLGDGVTTCETCGDTYSMDAPSTGCEECMEWRCEQSGFEEAPGPDERAAQVEAALAAAGVEAQNVVAELLGGTVEAEVTAAEVDAAAAATDDAPLTLPAFADMTPLEQRSHLYLLHGVYGHDLQGKAELDRLHADAHFQRIEGKLQSRHVPHVHTDDEVA